MSVEPSFLKTVTLFQGLTDEELATVASRFREREYVKHEIVFHEEDTGNYMYIVQEGRVKVSRLLPNGKEMILAFHETGEYFGEMSLIDGGTSPATVTSVIPSRVLTVTRDILENTGSDYLFRAKAEDGGVQIQDVAVQIEEDGQILWRTRRVLGRVGRFRGCPACWDIHCHGCPGLPSNSETAPTGSRAVCRADS